MDKSSSLGMPPWSPQEISKKYKRQSLGMPKASPLHQQKAPGHYSMRYIFIASCNMCYSWSVFIFCCVFFFSIKLDPIILYFGVRHAPLHCIFTLEWDTLRCTAYLLWSETRSAVFAFCFGERHAPPVSSLIFPVYYLWELFQISWLVLEVEKNLRVFRDANESLFRLCHRLWHVVLDFILWTYQLCLYHDLSQITESVYCAIRSFMHCF